jgi:DnaD/phage-associated family protein
MTPFSGFPPGKTPTVAIHAQFFSEVLPMIDDLAELKVILFCYWALLQKEGHYRYLCYADFANDSALMSGLSCADATPQAELDRALTRAIEHGILLAAEVLMDGAPERLYFVNTARGRTAIQQIAAGRWQADGNRQVEILPERPNVYTLYEENIGPLTPVIAERLKDAERDYPYEWLIDAINQSIENNVRRWSYIAAILERWKKEGRSDEASGRNRKENSPYAGLKWSDFAD